MRTCTETDHLLNSAIWSSLYVTSSLCQLYGFSSPCLDDGVDKQHPIRMTASSDIHDSQDCLQPNVSTEVDWAAIITLCNSSGNWTEYRQR
jgi:hypothetical protein